MATRSKNYLPMMISKDNFFERVYNLVKNIPPGRVTTYGAIAKALGSPMSSRMVGWALNNCHGLSEFVPAHRVVNRIGMLTGKGHFQHPDHMQELLNSEGVQVVNDKVVNFEELFWEPYYDLI